MLRYAGGLFSQCRGGSLGFRPMVFFLSVFFRGFSSFWGFRASQRRKKLLFFVAISTISLFSVPFGTVQAQLHPNSACLITKTETDPFYVKMKEGALLRSQDHGIQLRTYAGTVDGDLISQVRAIETCITQKASVLLIAPSDSRMLVQAVTEAREEGLLVIALDTPFEPPETAHATFASDNFKAGFLVGSWARYKMGDEAASEARLVLLNLNPSEISLDYLRYNGFLEGFGIEVNDPLNIGDERDPRIVATAVTYGSAEHARQALEAILQRESDIDIVYTVNEVAAAGAYEALRQAGRDRDVLIVSIGGGCDGIRAIQNESLGATAMLFPLLMAFQGINAAQNWIADGQLPVREEGSNPGADIFHAGVELVTDDPVLYAPSINTTEGIQKCWG